MEEEDFHKQPTLPGVSESKNGEPFVPISIPEKIGPYKIESLLERGGMSLLYLGSLPNSNDPTTIKVISPKFSSNPEIVKRFLNEAEIISMTNHPNIVKLYGHGEWEGGVYIAMEFIHGVTLRQYILQHKISLKYALEIIIDIAYALIHLHTHGVIHRDLKPENILVTDKKEIKVIDFGIAQLLTERQNVGSPSKPRLIGTPVYMSPEQKENPEMVSYPSDIYSLGIIAYELILGKLSHGRVQLSLMPQQIQKILTKALLPNPENRYQDVVDFVADISAFIKTLEEDESIPALEQAKSLTEELRLTQINLISKPPDWTGIKIGLSYDPAEILRGIVCEFNDFSEDKKVIIISEIAKTGMQGVIQAVKLQGMFNILKKIEKNPNNVAEKINELLAPEIKNLDMFSYLIISPEKKSCEYLCYGQNNVWMSTFEEKMPKILPINEIKDSTQKTYHVTWKTNANFMIASKSAIESIDSFILTWSEIAPLSPQEQADTFLKKIRFQTKTPMSSLFFLIANTY